MPFLCAFSLKPNRVVHVADVAGSTCLLVQRPDGIDLLCPPLPFDNAILDAVIATVSSAQKGRLPRILWVDSEDVARLDKQKFEVREKDVEYFYDPKLIAASKGAAFRDVRKRVRRFERSGLGKFRVMVHQDVPACHRLLRHWRKYQGRRHPFLLDWGYTRAALDQFVYWSDTWLRGWCVEVEGQVCAFAMTGHMQPDLAHFFIAKTDPDFPDLSYFLRWRVYCELKAYRWVNDAGDLGLTGMRQFKQKFRPIDEVPVFSADPI